MISDSQRAASVFTSLPVGELVFYSMTGHEALGRPFSYDLKLLSENPDINLSELLGEPISVSLKLPNQAVREFNGFVSHCVFDGNIGRHFLYRVTVRPWLWLLGTQVRSRIFQNEKVPEVIDRIFRDHGFSDIENALAEQYRRFEYLVQYRESDLNFVCRLMELEGIYFFFKHEARLCKIVLADSYSAHEVVKGYESVPYYAPSSSERRERDHVSRWSVRRTVCPAKFSARDFNFTRPGAPIMAEEQAPLNHAHNGYEVYDYPGKFLDTTEAQAQGRVRLEELQAGYEYMLGEGNARGLGCGNLFSLTKYPRNEQNQEYLIVESNYDIKVGEYDSVGAGSGVGGEDAVFHVGFRAIESHCPYRSPQTTRKPVVEGPQTATVVGKKGDEIWTDEYGRVRLHFHWDREGKQNETSSCWVRVSQAWAGMNWGSIHTPRVGHEVIVSFLDGDPDRPIVTGRVYNAANKPPYPLPLNQTQSGIKSHTDKGGEKNFNEIRFEDKKGAEDLYIQAERTQTTFVKASQSVSVGGSQSVSVGGDRTVTVTGNDTEDYRKERTLTVNDKDTETFLNERSMTVTLKSGETHLADHIIVVDGNELAGYNKDCTIIVGTKYRVSHKDCAILLEGTTAQFTNKTAALIFNGADGFLSADGDLRVSAGNDGSAILLSSSGISVKSKVIQLEAENISLKATGMLVLDGGGSKVELSSAGATVTGTKVYLNS